MHRGFARAFAQAAKVMRRVDANDDGVMDLREFEAYFERTSRALYAFRCRQRKQEKKQCARVRVAAAAVSKPRRSAARGVTRRIHRSCRALNRTGCRRCRRGVRECEACAGDALRGR